MRAVRLAIASLLMACACAGPVHAQEPGEQGAIRGRVVDARTGAAVARVLVQLEHSRLATSTDADGRFELAPVPAGSHRLFISVVGYILVRRDVEIAAGRTLDLTIPLAEGTGTYSEVLTVTADRFRAAQPAVAAQHTLGSLDIQNLRGVLADDPLRAVQVLPGVAAGDDLRSEFSVRASSFTRINLTVDGFATPFLLHTVRAVEEYSSSGSVAMINSDILEEVTLLNGAYSQRFGNRTGAEVDFRLREGSRDRQQMRVAVSGTNASTVLEGPLGASRRGSWLVSARQSYLDLFVERLIDEGLHFGFSDAQAKIVFDVTPSQRAEVAVLAGRSRLKNSDEEFGNDELYVGRNASAIGIGRWRLTSPRTVVTAGLMGSFNTFSNDAVTGVRLDDGHDGQVAGRIDAEVAVRPGLAMAAGAAVERVDQSRRRQRYNFLRGEYRFVNDYSGEATRSGAHAELRLTRGPVTIIPGVRGDHWSLTGESTASPWLKAEWRIAPTLALRGGTGAYRQFPDFEQVIGAFGRPDARAERAAHYDVGLEHRLGSALRWQITVYDREERGFYRRPAAEARLVNGRVVNGSTAAPYAARLDGFARGVEVLVQRKSTNGISGWLAYSYGRNRYMDRVTGESFWGDLDQRHAVNLYVFGRLSERFSLSAKLRAGTNTPAPGYYTERDGVYYLAAERNTMRLPAYARLDLRANRTFNWTRSRLTLFAEVMNVLNRENVRYRPPSVNRITGRLNRVYEPLIPIVPSAGVLFEF